MILDNEEQRTNLLAVIREVNISGRMEEAIQIINMLKGLEHDVQNATIGELVSKEEVGKVIDINDAT